MSPRGDSDHGGGGANAVPTTADANRGFAPSRAAHRGARGSRRWCHTRHTGGLAGESRGEFCVLCRGGSARQGRPRGDSSRTNGAQAAPARVPAGAGPPCQPSRGHYGSVRQLRPPDPPRPPGTAWGGGLGHRATARAPGHSHGTRRRGAAGVRQGDGQRGFGGRRWGRPRGPR